MPCASLVFERTGQDSKADSLAVLETWMGDEQRGHGGGRVLWEER